MVFFSFPEMLEPMSTTFKTFETEILEHVRFLFCLFTITTQNLFSETYTVGRSYGFVAFIPMVLVGLKQMLVFTK